MSEALDMSKKYQEHYQQIISGTLSDTIIKSISYQANIKLANDVIAENEKMIKGLQSKIDELNKELEETKKGKNSVENQRILTLENTIKGQVETISKLNINISELNKQKSEYDKVKHQVQHVDTFRNELEKAREQLKNQQEEHSKKVEELNKKIDYLQLTPAKRKKVAAPVSEMEPAVVKEIKPTATKAKVIKQDFPEVVIKRDGGSF